MLLALYSVRNERAFCEELDCHLRFCWFLDMSLVKPSFDAATFVKNHQRLLQHAVAQCVLEGRALFSVLPEVQQQSNRPGTTPS